VPRRQRVAFQQAGFFWTERGAWGPWLSLPFEGLPWSISVRVAEVGGFPQIVCLKLEVGMVKGQGQISWDPSSDHLIWAGPRDMDPTITTDLLRQLPLRQLRAAAIARFYEPHGLDWLEPFKLERPSGGWPTEHYRDVAVVYRSAHDAPLVAIRQKWNVSRAAASKWVAKARELGYLGYPIRPGVAGATENESPIKGRTKKSEETAK